MRTNTVRKDTVETHEGAPSSTLTPAAELRRTVMANMLFEDTFYESGVDAATRIKTLIPKVSFEDAAKIAIEAREKMKLRHVPLLIVRELLRNHSGRKVGDLVFTVIQRPDEIGELLALYWAENKNAPLTAQLKIGLARAIKKFDKYQLSKWNKDGAVKLRDALFLSHARPRGAKQRYTKAERKGKNQYVLNDHELLFKGLAENTLEAPDTWEVNLSAGADKKETFERLINSKQLGALALLRNLRKMLEVGVSEDVIRKGLATMKTERVLPFRFIAAARHAPRLEDALEPAMFRALAEADPLPGKTAILIDHSGSMTGAKVSGKSEIDRFDAACAVAMILREKAERVRVFAFSTRTVEVAPRRGFALTEQVRNSMEFGGTMLKQAVESVYRAFPECERLIVITDEQSRDRPAQPRGRGYIINVAGYQQGIGYGPWVTIDGWSEHILSYIAEYEKDGW